MKNYKQRKQNILAFILSSLLQLKKKVPAKLRCPGNKELLFKCADHRFNITTLLFFDEPDPFVMDGQFTSLDTENAFNP